MKRICLGRSLSLGLPCTHSLLIALATRIQAPQQQEKPRLSTLLSAMAQTPALCRLPAPDTTFRWPIRCSHPVLSPQSSTAWLWEASLKAATQGMAQQPGQREWGSLPPCCSLAKRAQQPSAKGQAAIKAQKKMAMVLRINLKLAFGLRSEI